MKEPNLWLKGNQRTTATRTHIADRTDRLLPLFDVADLSWGNGFFCPSHFQSLSFLWTGDGVRTTFSTKGDRDRLSLFLVSPLLWSMEALPLPRMHSKSISQARHTSADVCFSLLTFVSFPLSTDQLSFLNI